MTVDGLPGTSVESGHIRVAAISIKSGQTVSAQGFPKDFVATAWTQWFQNDGPDFRNDRDEMVLATGNGAKGPHSPLSILLSEILASTPDRIVSRLKARPRAGVQTFAVQRALFSSFARPKPFAARSGWD